MAWRVKIRMTFPTMIIMANSIFLSYKMAVEKLRSQILKRKNVKRRRLMCREQMYGYQGGKGWGGRNWETGIDTYTLLILCKN